LIDPHFGVATAGTNWKTPQYPLARTTSPRCDIAQACRRCANSAGRTMLGARRPLRTTGTPTGESRAGRRRAGGQGRELFSYSSQPAYTRRDQQI